MFPFQRKCPDVRYGRLDRPDLPAGAMVNRSAGCDNLSENVKVHESSGDIFCLWMRSHFDLGENAIFNYKYKDEVAGMAELLPVKICAKLHEDCEVSYTLLPISRSFNSSN